MGVATEKPQPQRLERDPLVPVPSSPLEQDTWQLPFPSPSRAQAPGCALPRVISVRCLIPEEETGPRVRSGLPQPQNRRQWPLHRPPAPCPPCGLSGPNRPRGPREQALASGQSPPHSEAHTQAERHLKAESLSLTAETFQASGTPACMSRTDRQTDIALCHGFNFLEAASNRVSPVPRH